MTTDAEVKYWEFVESNDLADACVDSENCNLKEGDADYWETMLYISKQSVEIREEERG